VRLSAGPANFGIGEVLDGTPYSLPVEASAALVSMVRRLRTARAELDDAIKAAQKMGVIEALDRSHAVLTVYESNSLEFEGPDLAGTYAAMHSTENEEILRTLNAGLLPTVLKRDPEAFAAIGLEMARLVANRYVREGRRGLSQADLRALHAIVVSGAWYAGQYRSFDAAIAASEHQPFPTFAIPQAMADYASWSRKVFPGDSAILRAAVGHAWFTHIHPFQDGNGRVARLATNVMLGHDGLPPAIVKAKSQRGQYLQALSHSDEGGDILPLVGLLLSTVERYIGELKRPRVFQRMFDDLVRLRGDSSFDWYSACMDQFFQDLSVDLGLFGLRLVRIDDVTHEEFEFLRRHTGPTQSHNVLAAVIADDSGQELALYQTRAAVTLSGLKSDPVGDDAVPSIAFALRVAAYQLYPWRRARLDEVFGLKRVWVEPDRPVRLCVEDGLRVQRFRMSDGVPTLADRIRKSFAAGFRAPQGIHRSTQWMSRVNGGPG
jgi:Fic family protein